MNLLLVLSLHCELTSCGAVYCYRSQLLVMDARSAKKWRNFAYFLTPPVPFQLSRPNASKYRNPEKNWFTNVGCYTLVPISTNFGLQTPETRRQFTIFLGAHSAKVELSARASIRLACFAGTCQILVRPTSVRRLWDIRRWRLIIKSVRRYFVNGVLKSYRNWKKMISKQH